MEERPAVEEHPQMERSIVEERPLVAELPVVEGRETKPREPKNAEFKSGLRESPFKGRFEPKPKVTPAAPVTTVIPKYVEAPALRQHGFGPRNLFWGVGMLFAAVVLLLAALFFAGPKVMLSLATSLLTFTALFVLSRTHVFRQRNGGFLALAVVCLLGTVVPLLEFGFSALKGGATTWARSNANPAPATAAGGEVEAAPSLVQSFALVPPQGMGKRVRATKDVKVLIDQRPFTIKAGDAFPFLEVRGGEAFFAVRDMRVSLPASVVEIIDPSRLAKGVSGGKAEADPGDEDTSGLRPLPPPSPTADDLKMLTASAQAVAMRRYPALGIQGSSENSEFLEAVQRLKQVKEQGGDDYFADPEWPLALAETLAQSRGWARGSAPSAVGPAPVLDAPARRGVIEDDGTVMPAPTRRGVIEDEEPVPPVAPAVPRANIAPQAPLPPLPPVDALDAGSGLPGGAR